MDNFELIDPRGTDINEEFLKSYRDSLKDQYESNIAALNQSKRNNETAIMSGANRQGLMYSNFPQRAKIQNEASYLSNLANLNTTYQTGLDKLRNNSIDSYNKIKDLEDQIADLNEYAASNKNNSNTSTSSEWTKEMVEALKKALGNQDDDSNTADTDNIKTQQDKLNEESENSIGSKIGGAAIGSSLGGLGTMLIPGLGIYGPLIGGYLGWKSKSQ